MSVTTSARPAQPNIQLVLWGAGASAAMPAEERPTVTRGAFRSGVTRPEGLV